MTILLSSEVNLSEIPYWLNASTVEIFTMKAQKLKARKFES